MSATVSDTPHAQCSEDINENEINFMLTPDARPEIKDEPPEDIDDTPGSTEDNHEMNGSNEQLTQRPNIRLTPTMKLMASPYAVDPKRKFPCPYDNCTKSYGKSSHLRSHLTWHTGIKPYVCQEPNCGKSFTRSDELNRHSRTHTGEKPFECMQCAKKFSRSDHLTKHVATHTKHMEAQKRVRSLANINQKPPSPTIAPSPVSKKPALTELTEMSLPQQGINYNDGMHFMASLLECTQFKHGRHVIEHENLTEELSCVPQPIRIKLERPENSDEYKVVNNETENCSEEGENLLTPIHKIDKQDSASARENIHPQNNTIPSLTPRTQNNSSPVDGVMQALTEVNATLNDEDNGIEDDDDDDTNDDAIMPEANAPPLPLAGAPYAVPHFGYFEEDIDPERPYRCRECMKCFKRQDDLNRHLRTHTGEKPYACTNCPKRFMRSDHLKKHLKTHSKQR